MLRSAWSAALLLVALPVCPPARHLAAAEWGDLTGRFVFDGTASKPAPLSITKDQEVCGKHALVDESLLVNASGSGLANVVIYLFVDRGGQQPPIHESHAEAAKSSVALSNKDCRYEPHVALLQTSQELVIGNRDTVGHNTKVDTFANPPINPIIPAGAELKQKFSQEERLPARVSCSIHPWMNAWLVVRNNPYFAVSNEDGKFVIQNVPAGEWTFQVWHEKAGYVTSVKKNGAATQWSKGRFTTTIKPGANDLGELSVPATLFAK